MALFFGNLRSETLAMETQVALMLPQDRCKEDAPYKVLYLLHGLGENASSWARHSGLELMLQQHNVVVVMPEVQRSFYCDMAYGSDYYTYITQELPSFVARSFHVSRKREDTLIAGLSMGGFGAFKCGLSCPEQYGYCASFSGALSLPFVRDVAHDKPRLGPQIRAVLGQEMEVECENDLAALARQVALLPPESRPKMFATCGTSDRLLEVNRKLAAQVEQLSLDFTYLEWEGDHNWAFWSRSLARMLEHFLGISSDE